MLFYNKILYCAAAKYRKCVNSIEILVIFYRCHHFVTFNRHKMEKLWFTHLLIYCYKIIDLTGEIHWRWWRAIAASNHVCSWFGWKPTQHFHSHFYLLPANEIAGRLCLQSCLSIIHSIHGWGRLPCDQWLLTMMHWISLYMYPFLKVAEFPKLA